ncbi:MAG TPA: hypothetical protein VF060_17570 [Trebonia sp.]
MRVIQHRIALAAATAGLSACAAAAVAIAPAAQAQSHVASARSGSTVTTIASTVPGNGDVNPYGVAVVPRSEGSLRAGNVLVSNFNNVHNQQGTGTTIVQISPGGKQTLFAQINPARLPGACPGGVGLTTALTTLNHGWVVVGSLPTKAGDPATSKAGCLLVLNSRGKVVETFHGNGINGPWDMTAANFGNAADLFVTNVLNGTVAGKGKQVNRGTVLRLLVTTPAHGVPRLLATTVIGSGFAQKTDPAALVIGPTGVGLARNGQLYIADTLGNRIAAIPDALFRHSSDGTGRTLSRGKALNGPLGLTIAPGGNVLTVNSGDGNLVAVTPGGRQAAVITLDTSGSPPGAGALFGLANAPRGGVYFVDDATNTLNLLH